MDPNIFTELYPGSRESNAANRRLDLRARESILGEYIKDRDLELKKIANYDLQEEERLRKLDWYNFNFHILALKRRNDEAQNE
jgi:hypothetical protein